MPKSRDRHKKTSAQSRKSGSPRYGKPRPLADLLARPAPALSSLARRAAQAEDWLRLVRGWVAVEQASHVTSAVERNGTLTIYVASAAWAARLRFEAGNLLVKARGHDARVEAVQVKVLPPARKG
jgi:predicted nucleic acid-binding Zn ribbon protein